MSLSLVTQEAASDGVRCEYGDCEAVRTTAPGQSVEDLRTLLREQGWLCVNGVDVCPPHRPRRP